MICQIKRELIIFISTMFQILQEGCQKYQNTSKMSIRLIILELGTSLFLQKIQEFYPTLKKQYKVEWCKNKNCLPFDFVIEELKIIIEIDGPQHFVQVAKWTSPEIQKEKDKFKINCANENGFSVIRLLQIDILKDNFDWIIIDL